MTEEAWLQCSDPTAMLEFLNRRVTDRKLRLFAASCLRQNWDALYDPREQQAVEVAEQLADGRADDERLKTAEENLLNLRDECDDADLEFVLSVPLDLLLPKFSIDSATSCARCTASHAEYAEGGFDGLEEELRDEQAFMLRDIVGNPFRPVAFNPRWRSADTVGLARGIYDERAFDRLPLLADALMDAGCADEQVIGHCRSDGPHVRGCWVVDLVLGKE